MSTFSRVTFPAYQKVSDLRMTTCPPICQYPPNSEEKTGVYASLKQCVILHTLRGLQFWPPLCPPCSCPHCICTKSPRTCSACTCSNFCLKVCICADGRGDEKEYQQRSQVGLNTSHAFSVQYNVPSLNELPPPLQDEKAVESSGDFDLLVVSPEPQDVGLSGDAPVPQSQGYRTFTDGVRPEYCPPCTACPGPVECYCVSASRVWSVMDLEDENMDNERKRKRDDNSSSESDQDISVDPLPVVDGKVQPPTHPPADRPGNWTNQLAYLETVVKTLWRHRYCWPFKSPVDTVALNLPDYHSIIKHPMDLGTVRERLENRYYESSTQCVSDIDLVFNNCLHYNNPEEDVAKMAKVIEAVYKEKVARMPRREQVIGIEMEIA